jgi:hypothetical protein
MSRWSGSPPSSSRRPSSSAARNDGPAKWSRVNCGGSRIRTPCVRSVRPRATCAHGTSMLVRCGHQARCRAPCASRTPGWAAGTTPQPGQVTKSGARLAVHPRPAARRADPPGLQQPGEVGADVDGVNAHRRRLGVEGGAGCPLGERECAAPLVAARLLPELLGVLVDPAQGDVEGDGVVEQRVVRQHPAAPPTRRPRTGCRARSGGPPGNAARRGPSGRRVGRRRWRRGVRRRRRGRGGGPAGRPSGGRARRSPGGTRRRPAAAAGRVPSACPRGRPRPPRCAGGRRCRGGRRGAVAGMWPRMSRRQAKRTEKGLFATCEPCCLRQPSPPRRGSPIVWFG